MNIPNIITILRILLVPLLAIFLLEEKFAPALLVFLVAGVSDGLDGLLARLLRQQTRLGAILDPLADKALLVTAFVLLAVLQTVPAWLAVLVVSRDLLILGGIAVLLLNDREVVFQPSLVSKLTTFSQLATVAFFLGQDYLTSMLALRDYLIMITAILTVLSAISYVVRGVRILGGDDDGKKSKQTAI